MIKTVGWFIKFYCNTPAAAFVVAFVTFVWHARFVSSSLILCSIKKWAVLIACGAPLIVTIRFLVPGAKVPFFEIWILAPEMCWISMRLRPPGPVCVHLICVLIVYSGFEFYNILQEYVWCVSRVVDKGGE